MPSNLGPAGAGVHPPRPIPNRSEPHNRGSRAGGVYSLPTSRGLSARTVTGFREGDRGKFVMGGVWGNELVKEIIPNAIMQKHTADGQPALAALYAA